VIVNEQDPNAPPPPNPDAAKAQATAQAQVQGHQMRAQAHIQGKQIDAQTKQQTAMSDAQVQLELAKIQSATDIQIAKDKAQIEADTQYRIAHGHRLAAIQPGDDPDGRERGVGRRAPSRGHDAQVGRRSSQCGGRARPQRTLGSGRARPGRPEEFRAMT
jgi:hypothetical protein